MKRTHIDIYKAQLVKESSQLYGIPETYIHSPIDAFHVLLKVDDITKSPNEHMVMMALNTHNQVVGFHDVFSGTVNSSLVNPRDIFQRALLNNASSIMIAHNHPSGSLEPSDPDLETTKRLASAGLMMGIPLLDHLIVMRDYSGCHFYSLADHGFIKKSREGF